MFCSYTILHHMFIIIWNFWVILLFFYSLTHHKCGLCSRIIYAGLKRGISFNASLRISLEFISQICILLSTKSPGDEGQNHTVTHTHMHIKYQSEWKKRKKQGIIKEKYLIQLYLNQEEDFLSFLCASHYLTKSNGEAWNNYCTDEVQDHRKAFPKGRHKQWVYDRRNSEYVTGEIVTERNLEA